MTETRAQIRLASTAIVAALAISSTALLAQGAPPSDTSVETPAPTAPDPLAPAPTTDTNVAPETTVASEVTPATSEAAPARPTRAKAARRAASTTRPAPAPAETATTSAPAAPVAEPVQALPAAEAAPIAPAPPVTVAPAASRQMQMNVILAIVGAVLLGLVALAAGAVALRRRKRRAAEVEDAAWQAEEVAVADTEPAMAVEPEPVPVRSTEPAFFAPAAAAAVSAPSVASASAVEGPVTELPEGFDLSRFGHNVQQAYKGPTADNPSLSLKHRLRKAAAMDQMERNLDAEIEAATGESVLDEADAAPPAEAPAKGDFMLTEPGKAPAKPPAFTY